MKPSLQVRLSQHLALTPQLQQSIRLLQLSTLELHQEVEQMLEQNPFLEPDEDAPAPFEPLAERTSAAERAGERESERAAESTSEGGGEAADDAPALDSAERDDLENGTERDDFDGIGETPGKSSGQGESDDFDYSEDWLSTAIPAAGSIWVKVSYSAFGFSSAPYTLLVSTQ